MKDVKKLKDLCATALKNPLFQPDYPVKGVTHCNGAVQYISEQMGFDGFRGMLANQIIDRMLKGSGWQKVDRIEFSEWAQAGGLSVCGEKEQEHGHVTVGYPAPMELSGSLGIKVPMIANIGKTIGVMKVSAAFPVAKGEPEYFIYI